MRKIIKWQTYEDYVNTNLNISKMMMTGQTIKPEIDDEDRNSEDFLDGAFDSYDDEEDDDDEESLVFMRFPVTPDLLSSIKLATTFDCWVAHSNFDITPTIHDQLNDIPGVELLKVLTRYRFLIGVGKVFEFTNIRHEIRNTLKLDNLGDLNEGS